MKPITKEYFRKFSVLILLALFVWIFNYVPFILISEHDAILAAIFLFLLFGLIPLFIVKYSVKLSSQWFLFGKDVFQWSDTDGVHSVILDDIDSTEPYTKRKYPFSPVEMGMMIRTKSEKEIRIMSNNLEADDLFMKRLQELYLAGDDTFTQYFEEGIMPKVDAVFNENLKALQKRMCENDKKIFR